MTPGERRLSLPALFAANAALVLACASALYPLLWVLKMALSPSQGFSLSANPFPDTFYGGNFKDVIGETDAAGRWLFGRQLANSLAVAGASTLVGLALSTTAAYAASRFQLRGKDTLMRSLLVTQMFPGVMMMIPLYIIMDRLHLLDTLAGLVLVYSTTSVPFCTFMLKGYFDTLPKELEEAALIDGATRRQIFLKVALPLAKPALAVTALFSFMSAWNEFILAATFLNDAALFTLPVALQRHVGEYQSDWGRFAAGALLVSAPVMVLFYALQKHLVGGLTAGGVKG